MEFNEKLQKLRTNENLTQEELAEKLYVSRAAISKWESGRGYSSIDSLKVLAKYFHVTIDELIGTDEIIDIAQQDIKESNKKYTALICGILDCLTLLLFFLPVFGNGGSSDVKSVAMFAISGIGLWLKTIYIAAISITVLNGFSGIVISNFDKPEWDNHRVVTGIALSIIGTMLFILARQPYAGIFFLSILVIKGFLVVKNK